MKVTTLGCDWCRGVRPAVISPTLVVGRVPREGDPRLDLCGPHMQQLRRYFQPIRRTKRMLVHGLGKRGPSPESIEDKRAKDKARYEAKKAARANAAPRVKKQRQWKAKGLEALAKKRAKWAAAREEREQAILAALRKADHRLARPEIDKECRLTQSVTAALLVRLVTRGLVTRYSKGPHARYELASKARHGSNSDAA
jgi:hypothetical protein